MTNFELARRCHAIEVAEYANHKRKERASTTFLNVLQALEDGGQMTRQPAPTAGNPEKRTAPAAFNWSPLSIADATLRHAVEPYLRDPAVSEPQKRPLRSALRLVLPPFTGFRLGRQCPDSEIAKAAAGVPATRIHELPASPRALQGGRLATKTLEEYGRAIRHLMRYAAARDLIPLVLPPTRADSPWEDFKDHYWPLAPRRGVMTESTRLGRQTWNIFQRCCEAKLGPRLPRSPEELTAEQAEAAIRHGGAHLGLRQKMADMRRLLFTLRDERQAGPFAELEPNPYLVSTVRGRSPRFYLRGADGFCASGADWDGLVRIIRDNAPEPVAEAWADYVRYYRDYSSLSWREISRRRGEFPARPARRELDQTTQAKRIIALRAWLGVALSELAIDPRTLTPEAALGTYYEAIKNRLVDLWQERADWVDVRRKRGLPSEDRVSDVESAGLVHHILAAGLWALALYERSRFRRGQEVMLRGDEANPRSVRVDTLKELMADKTPGEGALLAAYIDSTAFADAVEADRRKRKGALTTAKDLARIIELMPADRWVQIHTRMLQQLWSMKERRSTSPGRLHRLAMDTLYTGVLLSTACREGEAAHIRLDAQFSERNRARRLIMWRGIDRPKTEVGHNGVLRPEIVPDWLLDLVLTESRAHFMRDQWIAKGQPERVQTHQHLFVNERGKAIGCVDEDPATGAGRDTIAMRDRQVQQSRRWLTTICRVAQELRIEIPIEHGELGEHAVRAAVGYAVYKHRGKQAASQLLGNTEDVLMESYAILDAREVDVAALPGFEPLQTNASAIPPTGAPRPTPAPVPAGAAYASFAEERDDVLRMAKEIGLPGDVVAALLREAGTRWGVIPIAGDVPRLSVAG